MIEMIVAGWIAVQTPQQSVACAPRDDIVRMLARRYGEHPVAVGVIDGTTLVELFARDDGASWTLMVTSTSGLSCITLEGRGLIMIPPGERS
jgi:hypothetical protein